MQLSRPLRTGRAHFSGIRLRPFKGVVANTRWVDVERAAVELPVAVGMEQSEIIERVGTAFGSPHHMVNIPSGIVGDYFAAGRTAALLPLPKSPETTV